jgi:hypothetical protein
MATPRPLARCTRTGRAADGSRSAAGPAPAASGSGQWRRPAEKNSVFTSAQPAPASPASSRARTSVSPRGTQAKRTACPCRRCRKPAVRDGTEQRALAARTGPTYSTLSPIPGRSVRCRLGVICDGAAGCGPGRRKRPRRGCDPGLAEGDLDHATETVRGRVLLTSNRGRSATGRWNPSLPSDSPEGYP